MKETYKKEVKKWFKDNFINPYKIIIKTNNIWVYPYKKSMGILMEKETFNKKDDKNYIEYINIFLEEIRYSISISK